MISGTIVWVLAALGNSVLSAANAEINRKFQQEPFRLNMVRTGLAALCWFPLALIQQWPTGQEFYVAALFSGLVITYGNIVLNGLSAKLNGRVAVLHIPMKAIAIFAVWPLIDHNAWLHLTQEQPWQMATGILFFAIMVAAINTMRQNDASWSAMKALGPVIVFYTAADIVARLQLVGGHDFSDKLIVYIFISMVVSAVFSGMMLPWRPHPERPILNPKLMQAAGWAAIITMFNHVCFFMGLTLAPNPAYVSMIALLAPLWLLIYHRLAGIPDNASPWAGAILVLASIGFLMVTL
ncbi:MAG: hypothetical protein WAZ18_07465 [Alphaproteobacteria bacterium]